jgi:plasmanylethanolamine desaturase
VSVESTQTGLPVHYELTRGQALFSAASIVTAALLFVWLAVRVASRVDLGQWWMPLSVLGGLVAADFASGLVHWAADTWGRDDCPVIGPRLLVPFRVHHVNPDDFLRRRFIDTNGEVAAVTVACLAAIAALPLERAWSGPAAVFGLAFCGLGSMTNQIHQWSHMPSPPTVVRALQSWGVLLGCREHAAHHARPYDRHYCITTGWCNRSLDAVGFFRRLEVAVTQLTGVTPRHDDRRYERRYATPALESDVRRAG